eukprot:TRINITY_DN5139_c0_g1_i2.p1 TRINITY_DN5139_c0_g1~~TRINITY_DN5139_c0_g1_i2.p1  ORF type:complete len:477 (-),score=88.43 TRINITY_DN5139_c0_g1_i2:30-1460(-)
MEVPRWKEVIYESLKKRNQVQGNVFRELVTSQMRLLQREKELLDRNSQLEKEVRQLRRDLSTRGGPAAGGLSESTTLSVEAEAKLLKLQEDLSASYKANSEKTDAILKFTTELRAANEKLKAAQEEIESTKKKQFEAEENCATLEDELKEREVTLNVLREELKELHAALVKIEETANVHRIENQQLLDRWMGKMNEEAEKMNEANEFFRAMMDACKRLTVEQKADELMATVRQKPVNPSLLESMSKIGFASVPSTIKRNFQGHKEEINDIKFNVMGSIFATGSNDKIIKLWDARSGALRSKLSGSVQSVMYVSFSPNEEMVLGAGNDNAVRTWSVEQCRQRHTLTGHTAKVYAAEFTSDSSRVVSGSHDRTLKVWDLAKGYCTRTIFCFSSCNDLAINSAGSVIASAHLDGSVRLWDIRQGDAIRDLAIHQKPITSCAISSDGRHVITLSRDNTMKMTDLRTFDSCLLYTSPSPRD